MHAFKKNMFYVPIWPSTDSSFKRISSNDNKGFKVQVMRSKIGGNAVFGSKTATAGLSIELGTSRTPSTTRFSNCPARRFAQPSCDYGDISAHISNRNRSILQKQAACYSRDLLPTVTFATRRSKYTSASFPSFFFSRIKLHDFHQYALKFKRQSFRPVVERYRKKWEILLLEKSGFLGTQSFIFILKNQLERKVAQYDPFKLDRVLAAQPQPLFGFFGGSSGYPKS